MENSLLDLIRLLRIPGNTFCTFKYPTSFQNYIHKILAKKLDIFVIIYLDNILIYTEDPKQYQFHKNKVRFLGYVRSAHGVLMGDKRIEVVKNWLKPKFVCNIQVFLSFANFY